MLDQIQAQLGHQFKNLDLLEQALTHRSYLNEHLDYPFGHNERLEFLGDAVISMIVSDFLYSHLPEMPEGIMSRLRIALIRTETLGEFARHLNWGQALRMARGEEETGGRTRYTLLCNCFEAIVGALYLDSDMETVRLFLMPFVEPALKEIIANQRDRDTKSLFQEWSQAVFNITPIYQTIETVEQDNELIFTVAVLLNETIVGQSTARNKHIAEHGAAKQALEIASLGSLHDIMDTVDPVSD